MAPLPLHPIWRPRLRLSAHQRPDETARTERGCPWLIECTVDGTLYRARSRSGAPMALARLLVAAGIPDQPMRVTSAGLAGATLYRSIHRLAGRTIAESATGRGPKLVRFALRPADSWVREGQNMGGSDRPATSTPPDPFIAPGDGLREAAE